MGFKRRMAGRQTEVIKVLMQALDNETDPQVKQEIAGVLKNISRTDLTLLLVEHRPRWHPSSSYLKSFISGMIALSVRFFQNKRAL